MKEKAGGLGREGEKRAAESLKSRGYRIIARNFRRKFGELDLVAEDGEELVFVEVKTRSSISFAHPLESITPAKKKRLILAAAAFIQENGLEDKNCRFDAVAVYPGGEGDWRVEVVKNAFEAG